MAGVYVGRLSTRIRNRLWARVRRQIGEGSAVLIYRSHCEQGFTVESLGNPRRSPIDLDGFQLFRLNSDGKT